MNIFLLLTLYIEPLKPFGELEKSCLAFVDPKDSERDSFSPLVPLLCHSSLDGNETRPPVTTACSSRQLLSTGWSLHAPDV